MPLTGLEILIIEDCDADVDLLREAFPQVHLSVLKDGIQAKSYLINLSNIPDLIFLDLNLPGIDGREVLKLIKNNKKLLHIPVIVLSTSESDADVYNVYSDHANCYIVKPMGFKAYRQMAKDVERYWTDVCRLPKYS